jgi:hypothetical protein
MSPAEELAVLEQFTARLRRRVEQQAAHVEALAEFPEIARRAGEILVLETEDLRRALIQLEELKSQVGDAARRDKEPGPDKSNVA